jgi:protein-S-isoprenylcysteine O-methyltransferase Ste14
MSPVPNRRSWLPGAALLAAAVAVAVLAGFALGVRSWPWYVGFAAVALLAIGWAERLWTRRTTPAPARLRGRLKVIQGGKAAPYDLAKDHSTDSQRYLM